MPKTPFTFQGTGVAHTRGGSGIGVALVALVVIGLYLWSKIQDAAAARAAAEARAAEAAARAAALNPTPQSGGMGAYLVGGLVALLIVGAVGVVVLLVRQTRALPPRLPMYGEEAFGLARRDRVIEVEARPVPRQITDGTWQPLPPSPNRAAGLTTVAEDVAHPPPTLPEVSTRSPRRLQSCAARCP